MLFETTKQHHVLIVKPLDTRLDARIADSFKTNMAQWIAESHRAMVLDLSLVNFIDSSGLGAIVAVLKLMGKNGQIAVCGLQPPVLALFKLTRMDKVFAIFSDADTAAATL